MADDTQPDNTKPESDRSDDTQHADDRLAGDEPYQELMGYEWTEKAYQMMGDGDLHGEAISREKIVRSRVWGPCPRCAHELDDQQTHTAVLSIMGTETRGWPSRRRSEEQESLLEVDVSCGCGDQHSGAPEGTTGCGVSFRVALPLQLADATGQI